MVFLAKQLQISGKVTSGKRDKFLHQFNIDAGSGKTPSSVISKFPMIDFSFSLSPLETFDSLIALKARSTNSAFCLPKPSEDVLILFLEGTLVAKVTFGAENIGDSSTCYYRRAHVNNDKIQNGFDHRPRKEEVSSLKASMIASVSDFPNSRRPIEYERMNDGKF